MAAIQIVLASFTLLFLPLPVWADLPIYKIQGMYLGSSKKQPPPS